VSARTRGLRALVLAGVTTALCACTTKSNSGADSTRADSARAAGGAPSSAAAPIDTQPPVIRPAPPAARDSQSSAPSRARSAKPATKRSSSGSSSSDTSTRPRPGEIIGHDSVIRRKPITLPVVPPK
jgi:hypothetical protein